MTSLVMPLAQTRNTLLSTKESGTERIDREDAAAMLKSENDRPISDCATLQEQTGVLR